MSDTPLTSNEVVAKWLPHIEAWKRGASFDGETAFAEMIDEVGRLQSALENSQQQVEFYSSAAKESCTEPASKEWCAHEFSYVRVNLPFPSPCPWCEIERLRAELRRATDEPAAPASNNVLPPLPKVDGYDRRVEGHYSARSMLEYASLAAINARRESLDEIQRLRRANLQFQEHWDSIFGERDKENAVQWIADLLHNQKQSVEPGARLAPHSVDHLHRFYEWLAKEMPSGTIIGDPYWWARKILAAACVTADEAPEPPAESPWIPLSQRVPDWNPKGGELPVLLWMDPARLAGDYPGHNHTVSNPEYAATSAAKAGYTHWMPLPPGPSETKEEPR